MTEREKNFRFRKFYEERLSNALWWGFFVTVLGTPAMFLMEWAGYRGKFKPWGDPIPFAPALAHVPRNAALIFILCVVGFAIFRPWAR